MKANQFEPVYDDRVNFVLNEMDKGNSREQIVKQLGLANWKSIDMHMRRRNFIFDKVTEKYVPKPTYEDPGPIVSVPTKITRIITRFEELGKEANPNYIAAEHGFRNAKEMASYLLESGYYWSSEKFNYILAELPNPISSEKSTQKDNIRRLADFENLARDETFPESLGECMGTEKFLPMLEFLYQNLETLQSVLFQCTEGLITKYAVPGDAITKSFYISDLLALLINEFCKDKNLKQRDVAEAAFIEYMRRNGYEREVDLLIKKR